tara:strand:+ start:17 stop:769 length:753 start_codon:yes stop_codon:yes gene_type:complete
MNENIQLKKPYLKKNTYISESENEIILKFNNINIKNISKQKNNYIIELYLNNPHYIDEIKNIDKKILKNYSEKNKKWFNNDLTLSDLNELFIKSYCTQNNTIHIVLDDNTVIIKNNKIVNLENDIINELKKNNLEIEIYVKLLGVFISKQSIKNKWTITKINIDAINNNIELSNKELENEWIDTFNDIVDILDTKKIEYLKRMKDIDIFKEKNKELLNEIKKIDDPKYWNLKINILKNNIKNILSINDNR